MAEPNPALLKSRDYWNFSDWTIERGKYSLLRIVDSKTTDFVLLINSHSISLFRQLDV